MLNYPSPTVSGPVPLCRPQQRRNDHAATVGLAWLGLSLLVVSASTEWPPTCLPTSKKQEAACRNSAYKPAGHAGPTGHEVVVPAYRLDQVG